MSILLRRAHRRLVKVTMDLLYLLLILGLIISIFVMLMLLLGDSDIILQLITKFGKPISSLSGKIVWVTGASSGIGEHLAYELAKGGCRLILSARREDELERVKRDCLMMQGQVKDEDIMVLRLDSLDFESHEAAVQKVIDRFGKIDILVNNAGRSQRADWMKTSVEVDREMLELNVLGVLSLSKKVLPYMIRRKDGHIVNMSSVTGKIGAPISGSYCGSKHAVQGWFDSLRIEIYGENITVTNLCPGPVFSALLDKAFTGTQGEEYKGKMSPKEKRMPTARCAYLCAVAIANKLDEAWISKNPVLLFMYLNQYAPNFSKMLAKKMGIKTINKIREGQN